MNDLEHRLHAWVDATRRRLPHRAVPPTAEGRCTEFTEWWMQRPDHTG